jgi:hypothetical protein
MLEDGVIIPYLMMEDTPIPDVNPGFQTGAGFEPWRRLADETHMSCLRLSWNDEENRVAAHRMVRSFSGYVRLLDELDDTALGKDFGSVDDPERSRALYRRIVEVASWSSNEVQEGREVTRQHLYEKFVVADGSDVARRVYDFDKPFAAEIKQLIDLKYVTNLGDSLDVYTITPSDSLRRTALQEIDSYSGRRNLHPVETNGDQIIDSLRRLAFADIQDALQNVPTLDHLSLTDVEAVRREHQWQEYRDKLARALDARSLELISDPSEGAPGIARSYVEMLAKAEEVTNARRGEDIARRVEGFTEVAIDIGLMTVNVLFHGDEIISEVAGDLSRLAGRAAARVAIRLGVGHYLQSRSRRRIDSTFQLLELQMARPEREARKLLDYLGAAELGVRERNGSDMASEGK